MAWFIVRELVFWVKSFNFGVLESIYLNLVYDLLLEITVHACQIRSAAKHIFYSWNNLIYHVVDRTVKKREWSDTLNSKVANKLGQREYLLIYSHQ